RTGKGWPVRAEATPGRTCPSVRAWTVPLRRTTARTPVERRCIAGSRADTGLSVRYHPGRHFHVGHRPMTVTVPPRTAPPLSHTESQVPLGPKNVVSRHKLPEPGAVGGVRSDGGTHRRFPGRLHHVHGRVRHRHRVH